MLAAPTVSLAVMGPDAAERDNGQLPSLSSPPLEKAKTRIPRGEARGSHERASRSNVRAPREGRRLTVTAYCATGNRNAAGKWPTVGTAAANGYPLGTRLLVQSIGQVVVEDRSAPGATDVDIYLGSDPGCQDRAATFGRQQLLVEVN